MRVRALIVSFDPDWSGLQTISKVDITQDFLLFSSMCAGEQSAAGFTGLPVGFTGNTAEGEREREI